MNRPRVSIGLPVYNGERYLEETMQSLLEQDFEDFEILACDNASSDGTLGILQRFAHQDSRIQIHTSRENRGAAWNYNRGVALAKGRYFKWAACDDLLSRDYLSACLELFGRQGPGLVLAYPPTTLIDEAGREIEAYDDAIHVDQESPRERILSLLRDLRLCNAVFGLHRLDVLRTSARIGPYVSSDVVLLAELALHGTIQRCERGRFYRRMHGQSAYGGARPLEEIALWFDTTPKPGLFVPRSKLMLEFMKSIGRAPIPERERIRSLLGFLRFWFPRNWRAMAGEWKRELLGQRKSAS